ncbi:MAG: hypothetical protein QM619_01800 [Micropruina sp.]|uniref:MFS transporter n=1 Tax=Micropruina sp. TaxID=2737536 RepID=UPI0039E35307
MPHHLPYRVLLRSMGWSFAVLGFLGRLPISVLPLALLLHAHHRLGSFGLAGLAAAALSLGGAAGAMLVGHLSDQWGHRVVGIAATVVQTAAIGGFLLWCSPDVPLAVVLALAAVIGFANPQLGAMARARWSQLAASRHDRVPFTASAMAWEGAIDEVGFVVGPVLATTLAAVAAPAPLLTALVLAWIGQVGFALHASALPPAHHGRHRHAESADRVDFRVLVPLAVALGGVGVLFGGSQTSIAAFFTMRGEAAVAGAVYGAMAVGSATMGLLSNRLPARLSMASRITMFGFGCAVLSPLLIVAWDAPTMAVACLLIGLAVGPTLVTGYAYAERISPPDRLSTVMTTLSTVGVIGVAAGAALAGQVTDGHSAQDAAWIATVGGLLAGLAGLAIPRRRTR